MLRALLSAALMVALSGEAANARVTLDGSRASVVRQNRVAKEGEYAFLRTPRDVRAAVAAGELIELRGAADYRLANVSFPYALPELALFLTRMAAEYRDACGSPLVVTSLTRPLSAQPRNASNLSVHPAGMAVDLRVPRNSACRRWLEGRLLALEVQGLLDVTEEHRPPHYHVALFPAAYRAHVEMRLAAEADRLARLSGASSAPAAAPAPAPAAEPSAEPAAPTESDGRRSPYWLLFGALPLLVRRLRGR